MISLLVSTLNSINHYTCSGCMYKYIIHRIYDTSIGYMCRNIYISMWFQFILGLFISFISNGSNINPQYIQGPTLIKIYSEIYRGHVTISCNSGNLDTSTGYNFNNIIIQRFTSLTYFSWCAHVESGILNKFYYRMLAESYCYSLLLWFKTYQHIRIVVVGLRCFRSLVL